VQLLSGLGLDLAKMVLIRHTPLLLVYHSIVNGSKSACVFDISPHKCGNDCCSFAINFLVTAVVMSAVLLGRLHCGSVLLWYLSRVLLSKSVVLVVVMLTRPQVSRPRPHPHVAAAQPVPDNAQRMNQHLRSSQVLATSLTMVNPVTELLLNDEQS